MLKIKVNNYDKPLLLIYVIAAVISMLMFFLCPQVNYSDTQTYITAKDLLLQKGVLDAFRPPLYPLFLAITFNFTLTRIVQNIIFLISIWFFYAILKMMTNHSRLIFAIMLIYVAHPAFIFYHNQLITESLSISLGAICFYYLIRYIKFGQIKYAGLFHLLMLILIFIKPAFLVLVGISVGLFGYLLITRAKRYSLLFYFIFCILSFSVIGYYITIMNKQYGVGSVSSVTDMNRYWQMKQYNLLETPVFENEAHNEDFSSRVFEYPYPEVRFILENYGWKELHYAVQNLPEKDLFVSPAYIRGIVGYMNDIVGCGSFGHTWNGISLFVGITFFQLIPLLILYFALIIYSFYKTRKIPLLSVILFIYIFVNMVSLLMLAPNDYGRLSIPFLPALLIVIMQLSEWLIDLIKRNTKQFQLQ